MLPQHIFVTFALLVPVFGSQNRLKDIKYLIQELLNPENSLYNDPRNPKIYRHQVDTTPFDLSTFGDFEDHPCRRECIEGQSMTCFYRLVAHDYQRLGPECVHCQHNRTACKEEHCLYGDGVPTPVMAFNRMIPGPAIEVCEGDRIQAYVLNMLTEQTTVHWHGNHMRKEPDMDGAPHITQYPIPPGEAYLYDFELDHMGTLWYHSHVGFQRGWGLAGALIIHRPFHRENHGHLYDYDLLQQVLMVQDIVYNNSRSSPTNILINGKGRPQNTSLPDANCEHRYHRIDVLPGKRYRIRVISNGVFNCPLEVAIESHEMLLISSDGNDIQPLKVDSFFMGSAERYDFVFKANQKPGNYWLGVFGNNNCNDFYQGAVIHYIGTPFAHPKQSIEEADYGRPNSSVRGNYCNYPKFSKWQNSAKMSKKLPEKVEAQALRSFDPSPWKLGTKFHTVYTTFSLKARPTGGIAFQIDGITGNFETLPYSLLQARDLINQNQVFCNRTGLLAAGQDCTTVYCECPNVIRLPSFQPVEMVVVNFMSTPHPFHTHGFTYHLVGSSTLTLQELQNIEETDKSGKLVRYPANFPAVKKDTIQIPGLGYIIVRFNTDNPGFWFYHCHIEPHALGGMIAVLKVGENHEMKRLPVKTHC